MDRQPLDAQVPGRGDALAAGGKAQRRGEMGFPGAGIADQQPGQAVRELARQQSDVLEAARQRIVDEDRI